MAVRGSLKTMGMPELLMWISHFQKSGTLMVRLGDSTRELGFERGTLTFSASSDRSATLGRLLITKGVITEEMHERARQLRNEKSLAVAKGLCQLGLIPEDEILRYLRKKAEKELFDIFQRIDGEFSFEENEVPEIELIPMKLNVANLVLRITQQIDENGEYDFDNSGVHLQLPPEA